MRIEQIRDSSDARLFQEREIGNFVACPPVVPACAAQVKKCRHASLRFVDRDVYRILLKRALAGLLTRMRTFDWQAAHGRKVGGGDGRGESLDVSA